MFKSFVLRNLSNGPSILLTRAHHGQFANVNGIKVHYEKVGTGPRNLLLLPGALGSTRTDFTPQLEGLDKNKYTMVAWDPPGFGYSRPPERDFKDFYRKDAATVAKLASQLGLDKYSVLGWSDGGITGMIVAASNPKHVEKLVVWGSNAYVNKEDRACVTAIRDTRQWSPKFRESFEKIYGKEGLRTLWASFVDVYAKLDDLCRSDLSKIECPTFLLHGDKDPMVAAEHPQYLVDHIKNIRLHRFPDGKHNIHHKYAKEFNKLVEEFLDN